MATVTPAASMQTVALERVDAPENVRELDSEHVENLKASIGLLGLLVPVTVRPVAQGRFELVAGFHRLAAARELGWAEIPYTLHDEEAVAAARAAENIARKQLSPYEEAVAVSAMLEQGLSEPGAARALGWSRARVTARVKLLELPARAQQMVGSGQIALSSVDQLRAIGNVASELLEAVIDLLEQDPWMAERLASQPGWVLDAALRDGKRKVFAAHLSTLSGYEISELKLGKKTEALLEEAAQLAKQIDRHSYGTPTIRFSQQDVDQARAAGVVIEFERCVPVIVDRGLYRELARAAIGRTVQELREKAMVAAAAKKQQARSAVSSGSTDPVQLARRERDGRLRELAGQAHGVNLDLGAGLLTGLSTVDPTDLNVARFLVYALLGPDHDGSPYTQHGEQVARLAASGVRLVIEEFRQDVTKTRKDGSRGKLRIDYGDHREPENAIAWLWRFIDGARTAGELYGRALVVIAAEQYATRLVVPQSQRMPAMRWSSHKDKAAKALKTLAAAHLPASLTQLERAVKRAQREYEQAETAGPQRSHAQHAAGAAAAARTRAEDPDDSDQVDVEESEEELDPVKDHDVDGFGGVDADELAG